MTRPNHTSGPWRIGDAGHTIFGPPTGEPAPQRIADLAPVDRKANARLIAAAPDMLAALNLILFAATDDADTNDGRVDRAAVAALARSAIRKATGDE